MEFEIVSFDLQGTLSDGAFSDEFWLETLPFLYAQKETIPLEKARNILKKQFKEFGKYDSRYYSLQYWLKELKIDFNFDQIMKLMKNKPHFFEDGKKLLKELNGKTNLIIISSTTKEFIDVEMQGNEKYFSQIFSSLDQFNIPGKPKEVYQKIAQKLGVQNNKILHIGDSKEMDIDNAKKAGFHTFYFDNTLPRPVVIKQLREFLFASR